MWLLKAPDLKSAIDLAQSLARVLLVLATFTGENGLAGERETAVPLPFGLAKWIHGGWIFPTGNESINWPRPSDVNFSTRFGKLEDEARAHAFHANKIVWVYSELPVFVDSLHAKGYKVGLTLNANPKLEGDAGYAKDIEGQPIIAPWMVAWGAKWMSSSSPEASGFVMRKAKLLVGLGADYIQFDDPELQAALAGWESADFSQSNLDAFRDYLDKRKNVIGGLGVVSDILSEKDYRKYLSARYGISSASQYSQFSKKRSEESELWTDFTRRSVREFHLRLKEQIHAQSGGRTLYSFNLPELRPTERGLFLADVPDFAMSEIHAGKIEDSLMALATMQAVSVPLVASVVPKSPPETRRFFVHLIANGGSVLVPWDVYVPDVRGVRQPRYFAGEGEYEDFFRFLRANQALLDGSFQIPLVSVVYRIGDEAGLKVLAETLSRLSDLGVPFNLSLSGGTFKRFQLDAEKLRKSAAVVVIGDLSDFSGAESQLLSAMKGNLIVTGNNLNGAAFNVLESLSPFGGGRGCVVSVRGAPSRIPSERLYQVHLSAVPLDSKKEKISCASDGKVQIKKWFVGARVEKVKATGINFSAYDVDAVDMGDSWEFRLNEFGEWAILTISSNTSSEKTSH